MTTLTPGMTAPAFSLPDTDGREVGFDSHAHGRKMLVFYKVTCPTCQFAMPFYDRLFRAVADSGIPAFAVVQDGPDDARSFAATYGVTMPQLIDDSPYEISSAYNVQHVPTLFIIGDDGRIEIASASFVKADLERSAGLLADAAGADTPRLFEPDESVPDFRPG